jgi:hypothetical protein
MFIAIAFQRRTKVGVKKVRVSQKGIELNGTYQMWPILMVLISWGKT